jgi:hypothetical protein
MNRLMKWTTPTIFSQMGMTNVGWLLNFDPIINLVINNLSIGFFYNQFIT